MQSPFTKVYGDVLKTRAELKSEGEKRSFEQVTRFLEYVLTLKKKSLFYKPPQHKFTHTPEDLSRIVPESCFSFLDNSHSSVVAKKPYNTRSNPSGLPKSPLLHGNLITILDYLALCHGFHL